jgi:hypothetical protein
MKIKARLLMPGLAALTLLAIVGTGIVLGQLRGGAPWVTLLGSISQMATVAEAEADAITPETEAVIVADSGLLEDGADQSQQPYAQPVSVGGSVLTETKERAAVQSPGASTVGSGPSVSEDSPDSESSPVLEDSVGPSLPEPRPTDGDADLGAPADDSNQGSGGPSGGAESYELPPSATRLGADDPAPEKAAVLLPAASREAEPETESAPDEVEEDD